MTSIHFVFPYFPNVKCENERNSPFLQPWPRLSFFPTKSSRQETHYTSNISSDKLLLKFAMAKSLSAKMASRFKDATDEDNTALKGHCHGYFERFQVNSVPESLIAPLPIHRMLLLNYEEDIT